MNSIALPLPLPLLWSGEMQPARYLNLVFLTTLIIASLMAWPDLPARIPVHFDMSGTPTSWAERSFFSWFGMPLLAVGLNLFLYLVMGLSMRDPRYINLPGKRELLALPEDRQRVVLAEIRGVLEYLNLEVTMLFCLVQLATYRAAHGGDTMTHFIGILLLSLFAGPALLILLMLRTQSAIARQVELEGETGAARG